MAKNRRTTTAQHAPADDVTAAATATWNALAAQICADGQPVTISTERGDIVCMDGETFADLGSSAADQHTVRPSVALTPRELEVLTLVAEGMTTSQVATRLGTAMNTVAQHLAAVRRKHGVHSTAEAVVAAGLGPPTRGK